MTARGVNSVPQTTTVHVAHLESRCHLGIARLAAAEWPASFEKFGAGGAVNRSVDTSATQQGRVGGIDDHGYLEG